MAVKFTTKRVEGFQEAIEDARKSWNSESDNLGPDDEKLMRRLSKCKQGSGHDSFLKGIVVWHDVRADHSFIPQLYRYHFRDTVSSQSKMHLQRGGKLLNISYSNCNDYVCNGTVDMVNMMIDFYNRGWDESAWIKYIEGPYGYFKKRPVDKKELFECIIMNMPIGYELEFGEITNYLQLKGMYAQRKSHKMSGWSEEFVRWVKSLPYSWLITGDNK